MESIISLAKQYGMNAVELRGVGGMLNNKEILDFSSENIADTRNKLESCGVSSSVFLTPKRQITLTEPSRMARTVGVIYTTSQDVPFNIQS